MEHFTQLLNTNFKDIETFLLTPAFMDDISLIFDGWNAYFIANGDFVIMFDEMHYFLNNSTNMKNLYIKFNVMCDCINKINFNYDKIKAFYCEVYRCYYELPNL